MVSGQLCNGMIWKSSTLQTGLAVFPEAAVVLCAASGIFHQEAEPGLCQQLELQILRHSQYSLSVSVICLLKIHAACRAGLVKKSNFVPFPFCQPCNSFAELHSLSRSLCHVTRVAQSRSWLLAAPTGCGSCHLSRA